MAQCANCGFENPPGELVCRNCDHMLTASESATRRLQDIEGVANFPRWGTATLGAERKLLFHVRGYDQPMVVSIADKVILGRYDTDTGQYPDVALDDFGAEEGGVSRKHAAITIEDEALKVVDLGSANFTYINGQKLISYQARILRDGDELRLGNLVIRVNFA